MTEPQRTDTARSLRWFGLTHRGRIRPSNEDSFLCLQFDAREVHYLGKFGEASTGPVDFVFAVSDGMGGATQSRNPRRALSMAAEDTFVVLPLEPPLNRAPFTP